MPGEVAAEAQGDQLALPVAETIEGVLELGVGAKRDLDRRLPGGTRKLGVR